MDNLVKKLTRGEFLVLNSLYNDSTGRSPCFSDLLLNRANSDISIMKSLEEKGYADLRFNIITDDGIAALEPYRVKGAVILAAGASTRFVPLSLDTPKGLFVVKGERLIERQIKQLIEAGIEDITIVLGYKKEMFFYLKDKYNVRFIFNKEFNIKNNIHSIYLARNYLADSYICSCDDYFIENPFNSFEYESFYAGIYENQKTNEMYVSVNEEFRINEMVKGKEKGYVLLGHSFWTRSFSETFIDLVEADKELGLYDNQFWEWLVRDNLNLFPPYYLKPYAQKSIYEFDYFDQLRKFDSSYIENTNNKVLANIRSVFNCKESDIVDFRKISEGLTNTSFVFRIGGTDYIYRHPGEGTEYIINRANEKHSLEIANRYGFDPTFVYEDPNEGWKISKFIKEFREPEYNNFCDSEKVINVLKKLHALPIKTEYGLNPWEDAEEMEKILIHKDPDCFDEFKVLKENVGELYKKTLNDGIEKCFCHGDTYKHNWMILPDDSVILIDWEYSGFSDPGIDIGYYIVDAMYGFDDANRFISKYLGDADTETNHRHYLIYTALIAYYWFVWAMYRESCGAVMGDSLYNWYSMAKKYSEFLINTSLGEC